MPNNTLVILPSLGANLSPSGSILLTEKFVSGVRMTVDHWDGPVEVLIQKDNANHSGNLDDVWVKLEDLPFRVTVADFHSPEAKSVIARAAVVQGGADHNLNHMPGWCSELGAHYVMVSEYTLRTRWQIIDAERLNPLVTWRRKVWAWRQERANQTAVKAAAAVQCNGTPTFDAYRPLNERAMLYFDSRVTADMLPAEPRLAVREVLWSSAKPMRLAFSGRLNRMKGVDHLPLVAQALRDRGVPFTMDIYGDGPLVAELQKTITRLGLQDTVRLGGVLDFASELMPTVRDAVDLFVCCHRQGDPSCTYLETLACGVPIVGYGNEAFEGLMRRCPAGESVPMNDWSSMAAVIEKLALDPRRFAEMARIGLAFAREHTFEHEFKRRIEHMAQLLASD
ncbi:MAG: glycosyltransferase [Hydrogenophaga sp.]|uniref:glycosyltransferase n=1 Tax=Hydrogenophaga sp. TaxID=1904254 RepID=UPI0025C4225C|nr:glycosyltransferase [Hydrogenophaga sp.]MBT9551379.1 glycosyltransferase [Hydrogenophaga sp.]